MGGFAFLEGSTDQGLGQNNLLWPARASMCAGLVWWLLVFQTSWFSKL